jgi:hypothetical protein
MRYTWYIDPERAVELIKLFIPHSKSWDDVVKWMYIVSPLWPDKHLSEVVYEDGANYYKPYVDKS